MELIQFTNEHFPDLKKLIFDCLRWDWCLQARSHYYPEFLRSELNIKAKQIGSEYLNTHKTKDKIILDNIELTVSDLKRAIYFMPGSNEFKQKNLQTSDIVIFVNGKPFTLQIPEERV